jgi:hypothetical protein
MNSKAFESIYNECNPAAKSACLELPLNTTSKPPMSFEDIYFECNLMPLFEQVLREMAATGADLFSTALAKKINEKIENWRSSTNREIINEEQSNNEMENIIGGIIRRNNTTEKPFAIKNGNCLLSHTENYANN